MAYPADLRLEADPSVDRWRPLVQWLLAIPHLAIANALQEVGQVVTVISWFVILFTGRLPSELAELQCLVIRYSARAYSYALWLRESYPPFEFAMTGGDPGTDPLWVDIQPALIDRDRLRVGLRFIWVIPALVFALLLSIALSFALLVAFFVVVFTGEWPETLRSFVIGCGRYFVRLSAYASLLNDEYPPFVLEDPIPPSEGDGLKP